MAPPTPDPGAAKIHTRGTSVATADAAIATIRLVSAIWSLAAMPSRMAPISAAAENDKMSAACVQASDRMAGRAIAPRQAIEAIRRTAAEIDRSTLSDPRHQVASLKYSVAQFFKERTARQEMRYHLQGPGAFAHCVEDTSDDIAMLGTPLQGGADVGCGHVSSS